jgi:hypothetical protein
MNLSCPKTLLGWEVCIDNPHSWVNIYNCSLELSMILKTYGTNLENETTR